MIIKSKRGIQLLGKTILEIMVAIVVVILLLYAGYMLFQTYFGNLKEDQAAGQLEEILETFNELELGEEKELPILAPQDWNLVSFDKNSIFINDFEKPFVMHGNDCLCICNNKKCEICRRIDKPVTMNGEQFSLKIPKQTILTKFDTYYDLKIK